MKAKKIIFVALSSFFIVLFSSNYSSVEAAESNNLETSVVNSEDITTMATPNPYKVWYSVPLNMGNQPPATYYVQHRLYKQLYRGWLTRTNRTDTHAHTIYEGYLYRPDVPLPILSRVHPIEQ